MPFTNIIIEGKAVKPYLSKATTPWWELKVPLSQQGKFS